MLSALRNSVRHITQVFSSESAPQSGSRRSREVDGFDGSTPFASRMSTKKPIHADLLDVDMQRQNIGDVLQRLRRTNGCELDFPAIRSIFYNFPKTAESMVWLGFIERMRGADPTLFLQPLLNHFQFGRLALVNLGAHYAINALQEEKQATLCLELLSKHLAKHPTDKFAALVKSLILAKLCEYDRYAVLESLYLQYPKYAACTSVMAALLYSDGLLNSAYDYAEESLRICPENIQALAVIRTRERFIREKDLVSKFSYLGKGYSGYEPESILFLKYDLLDPEH